MITTTDIENSIVKMLADRYPNADIFRRNAEQTKETTETFVVTVDLQAQTQFRDYQIKDIEITVQYFINDRLTFNRSYNEVRDTLISDIFINSLPIVENSGKIIKYLIVKDTTVSVIDDVLAVRLVSDYIDDTKRSTSPTYVTMGQLHLKKEY